MISICIINEAYTALWDNIVRIGPTEASALKQVHDIRFADTLLVETVFVLFEPNRAPQYHFFLASGKAVIRIVEYDFNWISVSMGSRALRFNAPNAERVVVIATPS
jgi:hypothetical protein